MFQTHIENALREGKQLKDVMDELSYVKICCRRTIMGSIVIVQLQKQLEHERKVIHLLSNLTVADTGLSSQLTSVRGKPEPQITILEEAPPGTVEDLFLVPRGPIGAIAIQNENQPELTDAHTLFMEAIINTGDDEE